MCDLLISFQSLFCILVDDFAAVASTKDVTLPHTTSRFILEK